MGTQLSKSGTFFAIRTRIGVQFSPRVGEQLIEHEETEEVYEEFEEDEDEGDYEDVED
jgi:hypothetical protein